MAIVLVMVLDASVPSVTVQLTVRLGSVPESDGLLTGGIALAICSPTPPAASSA